MRYKFESLEVWKLALKFNAIVYEIADCLPKREKYNLSSQIRRASTSIALNIAEGSTGQSDAEQSRFLSFAIRSYIEVIACYRLIEERNYLVSKTVNISEFEKLGTLLFRKLQAFRNSLK